MLKKLVMKTFAKADLCVGSIGPVDVRVLNDRFYRRVALFESLGLGDSYTDGDFACDLEAFFEAWMRCRKDRHAKTLKRLAIAAHRNPRFISRLIDAWIRVRLPTSLPEAWIKLQMHFTNQQSINRSKRVGKRHYDIGNELYRLMLGPTMAYSCGYWTGATKTLDEAQRNKYRHICEKLGLKEGMRVLEIGCGWGGFAAFAVREYGVTVVGVSISQEQINGVKAAYPEECHSGAIDLRFIDYREIPDAFKEEFDAIVSIGMFEHVGPPNYDEYMRIAWFALKQEGKFLLHSIVGTGGVDPFIWYRIFRGGVLPTEEQIERAAKPYFVREHAEDFGFDYYRTLMAWWENFKSAWPEIVKGSRYDERFYRMWEFYLKGCAGAFKVRHIQLNQYVLVKGGTEGGYQWNRPQYE